MSATSKFCNVWVVATKAEDVPDEWVAHCLDLDIISQGSTLDEALEAVSEAILMAVAEDLANDDDPLDRSQAPDECWSFLNAVIRNGKPVDQITDRSQIRALVTQYRIERPLHPVIDGDDDGDEFMPPIWQIAALESLRQGRTSHHQH